MTHIAALLVAVTAASQLGWGAPRDPVHCSWTRVLPTGEVHYTFLRGGPPSERLYHSVWSREERALLGCAWSDDAQAIREYLSRCRERAQDFSNDRDQSLDLDSLFGAEGRCHDEGSKVRGHRRAKRGFIVPGTLWCGSGNKAPSYADLGVFAETDSCCREHDQCKHTILSFHSDFGVFNTNIFTMSHCDCDNRFHSCLKEANDSISHVVGYTFFNLLKMNCFEFTHRLQSLAHSQSPPLRWVHPLPPSLLCPPTPLTHQRDLEDQLLRPQTGPSPTQVFNIAQTSAGLQCASARSHTFPLMLSLHRDAVMWRLQGPGRVQDQDPAPAEEIWPAEPRVQNAVPLQLHQQVDLHRH
uniref:phospholipase A2 n=1 Tax=Echeneis naucrates TaxID=173247 RepID=A0A665UD01_ECHNA